MNLFGTVMAWVQALVNSPALQSVASFITTLLHDEIPVAEQFVAEVVASLPADISASKPLVAFTTIVTQAAANAEAKGASVGLAALSMATTNAVNQLTGQSGTTQVDAGSAISAAQQKRDAAIAAANAEFASTQSALDAAANKSAAALAAKVSS